jgi:hypothetical protein
VASKDRSGVDASRERVGSTARRSPAGQRRWIGVFDYYSGGDGAAARIAQDTSIAGLQRKRPRERQPSVVSAFVEESRRDGNSRAADVKRELSRKLRIGRRQPHIRVCRRQPIARAEEDCAARDVLVRYASKVHRDARHCGDLVVWLLARFECPHGDGFGCQFKAITDS